MASALPSGHAAGQHAVRLAHVQAATNQFLGTNCTGFPRHNSLSEATVPTTAVEHSTLASLFPGLQAARTAALATVGREHDAQARVVINVSGEEYETCFGTLQRFPMTLLGDPLKRAEYWDSRRKQYFIDRHRPTFPAIIAFYQTGGRLHKPNEVPDDIFCEELEFYELGEEVIGAFKWKIGIIPKEVPQRHTNPSMQTIWNLFEEPTSSITARILALFSVAMIVLSVVSFCLETLPQFKSHKCLVEFLSRLEARNQTITDIALDRMRFQEALDTDDPFFIIETLCVSWFTIELICRFISSPSKFSFVKNIMNTFDLLAILPFFVQITLFVHHQSI